MLMMDVCPCKCDQLLGKNWLGLFISRHTGGKKREGTFSSRSRSRLIALFYNRINNDTTNHKLINIPQLLL